MRSTIIHSIYLALLSFFPLGCGISDGPSFLNTNGDTDAPKFKSLSFTNGQAASIVIGQPNFTSSGGSPSSSSLSNPGGIHVSPVDGAIYIADFSNNRVLVYKTLPTTSGASANLVIGQGNFTDNSSGQTSQNFDHPSRLVTGDGRLFVGDWGNVRTAIYNSIPTANSASADVAIGAVSTSAIGNGGCTAAEIDLTTGLAYGEGKLLVSIYPQNRVLIFGSVPTSSGASATLVLGQANFTTCSAAGATSASSMSPSGVWTDGKRLAVTDKAAHRVLIWNTFPTSNNQAADLFLGQTTATGSSPATTATSLASPEGVSSNGTQLFVADSGNNRVLIWNSWPTSNGQAADQVLGQPGFTNSGTALSSTGLNYPIDVSASFENLLVVDKSNNRVTVYKSK